MKSKPGSRNSNVSRPSERGVPLSLVAALALLACATLALVAARGWTLYYGDAEAHLNIARRLWDSRLPGYEQIGTVWLPLPHLLMAPFTRIDSLWHSGLAGALPSAACFVLAAVFLFLSVERLLGSRAAASAAALAFALNPNLLYLAAAPMTEPMSLCFLCGLLYFCARFRDSHSTFDALAAGLMACCGTLTRYEAWFLLPFTALYFLLYGGAQRWRAAFAFSVVAALGPLYWLGHNWVIYSDPLEFYRGRWSARAIYQRSLDAGMERYPGDHDWAKAWQYYRAAAELAVARPLAWIGVAGTLAALLKRAWWAAALLALAPAFYVLSLYSSGTPIYVPTLWPKSYYNTRYGLNLLPLACFGLAAWVSLLPGRLRGLAAVLLTLAAVSPWLGYPRKENWVCWRESELNSVARRAWTAAAAAYLRPRYQPGSGILLSFGDPTAILRASGIPIRESLHEGDLTLWDASVARPDLFLWQEWAIAVRGDRVSQAAARLRRGPRRYECVRIFAGAGSPPIEIWRHIQ